MHLAWAVVVGCLPLLHNLQVDDERGELPAVIRRLIAVAEDLRVCVAVIEAVSKQPAPDKAEDLVGYPASINTARDGWRDIRTFHIQINELKASEWANNSTNIVFWVLPGLRQPSAIIGIYWMKDGTAKLFTGGYCRRQGGG